MRTTAWAARARRTSLLAAGALAVAAIAVLVPSRPHVALAVGAIALAGALTLAAPTLLLVAVFPATFAYWRVGPTSINMSIADVATLLAVAAALPFVPWRSRALRFVLTALALYLGFLLVSVVSHPTDRAVAEWFHRAMLVGGSVVIGAAVARRAQVTLALRAFVAAAAVVSLKAIADTLASGFEAAYPWGMHKNAAGPLFAMGLILLAAVPRRFALRRPTVRGLQVLLLVGLAATQSRGAVAALVAALAIFALRRGPTGRRRLTVVALVASVVILVGSAVTLRDETIANPQFNSVELRVVVYDHALNDVWANHRVTGGGLKWFRVHGGTSSGPHDIIIAELSEAGIVGLLGLATLVGAVLLLFRRRRGDLGEAGFLVFVFIVLFGASGIFWVVGTLTLPMLVVGLAVGDVARERSVAPARTPSLTA